MGKSKRIQREQLLDAVTRLLSFAPSATELQEIILKSRATTPAMRLRVFAEDLLDVQALLTALREDEARAAAKAGQEVAQ